MVRPKSSTERNTGRTRRDWLEAGQERLRRGGLKALKLRTLAADLGVSTGSFYHHFADRQAYEQALADYFARVQIAGVIEDPAVLAMPPMERVRALVAFVLKNDLSRLALAMRAWGESDVRARRAVRQHDDAVMGFLRTALAELGHEQEDAMVRAYALMAIGHAHIHMAEMPLERLREGLLRLMCRTPDLAEAA